MELQNLTTAKSHHSHSFILPSSSLHLPSSMPLTHKSTRNEPFKFNKLILRAIAKRKLEVNAEKIAFFFLFIQTALKSLCLPSFPMCFFPASTQNWLSAIMTT